MSLIKLRESDGRFRRGSWVKSAAVALTIVGVFAYCAPEMWAHNQGSASIDPSVSLEGCSSIEGMLYCDFTDKETLRKWVDTYPETLEKEIEGLKIEAGKPVAILKKVCRAEGFIDSDCPRILFGMAMQESKFGKLMVGDSGHSEGYFHILDIHKLSDSCKYDLFCSAKWSLERMIRYGFKENRDRAVMAHNGTPNTKATLGYLSKVKGYMPAFDSMK